MAQLRWLRWLQSTAISTNPMTLGMVWTWDSPHYPTHSNAWSSVPWWDCNFEMLCLDFTNPCKNWSKWHIGWRLSQCGAADAKILLCARGVRLIVALAPMKMTDWTHVDGVGLKSTSFVRTMSISVMEDSHQAALLLNYKIVMAVMAVMAVMTACAFEFFHPVVQVEPGFKGDLSKRHGWWCLVSNTQ